MSLLKADRILWGSGTFWLNSVQYLPFAKDLTGKVSWVGHIMTRMKRRRNRWNVRPTPPRFVFSTRLNSMTGKQSLINLFRDQMGLWA